jgi:NAD+ synthase
MSLEKRIKLAEIKPEQAVKEIGDFIIETLLRIGSTGGVIGLSGGVDSTCVAAIAKKSFDTYNAEHPDKELELVGYILPSKTNSIQDTDDGINVAQKLGILYEFRSVEPIVNAYETTNADSIKSKFHRGNLTSEIRATVLHQKAATERKTVLGTGNKDEDFGVGYYTLFGDGAVHMSPIGNLNKRHVRQIARYFGFAEIADKAPSAGLEPGQTSFGDLGYSYETAEIVLEGFYQGFTQEELAVHSQVKAQAEPELRASTKFKAVEDVVDDILRRHHTSALPKMKIVHPPAAEVTMEYR